MLPLQDDNPTYRTPLVTYLIIAINVTVFLWEVSLSPVDLQVAQLRHGFIPQRLTELNKPGDLVISFVDEEPRPDRFEPQAVRHDVVLRNDRTTVFATLITCMFLHGGWLHLLGNMWFLWIFGDNVEERLGAGLYLILYLVGGVLATAAHYSQNPMSDVPVVGASGAIAAILGAYAVTWPWARVQVLVILIVFITIIRVPALLVLGLWFIAQVLAGTQAQQGQAAGVAFWAHIGGFLFGMAIMPLLCNMVVPQRAPQRATEAW